VQGIDKKLAAVAAAAEVRSARELLPPSKRPSFDAGLAASARDAGDLEYDEGVWWRVAPGGRVEIIPSVPEVRSAGYGEIEYSRRLGKVLRVR
jgi:hypothetical protein